VQETPTAGGERANGGDDGRPWVLIAEDNPVNQKVIEALLSRRGFRTVTASDGREALDLIDHRGWAGVLMDCSMPRMDGYETTTEIRRREAPDAHLPIVAMTAHAMEGDRERCLAAGMDDYLVKPVRGSALDTVVQRWLAQGGARAGPSLTPGHSSNTPKCGKGATAG